MKPERDAFGHEMLDYFNGRHPVEIVERDDGYIDTSGGAEAYFSEYMDWPDYEKEALAHVEGRVLDIGCGAGRHALYLQGKGFEVLGIDISPLAILVCKKRGLRKTRVMSVTQLSSNIGTFDTIIMMGNNFGLLGGTKRAKWLLSRFHRITSPEGRIIGTSNDPYKTTNPFHLQYHELNREKGRMPGQLRIRLRYQKYTSDWFDYLIVSQEEMRDLLDGTGWFVDRFVNSPGSMYAGIIRKHKR